MQKVHKSTSLKLFYGVLIRWAWPYNFIEFSYYTDHGHGHGQLSWHHYSQSPPLSGRGLIKSPD